MNELTGWSEAEEEMFEKLKRAVMSPAISFNADPDGRKVDRMSLPNGYKKIWIKTNASVFLCNIPLPGGWSLGTLLIDAETSSVVLTLECLPG